MFPLHPHDPPAIGPHRLLGRLGSDDTAQRYAAGTGGRVSAMIVLLRPGRATDPLFRGEFARQVEALRKLRSPYVCRVVGADTRGAVPWAAFARTDEETLADLVERNGGGLLPEEFSSVATALAAGLADLHEAGVSVGPLRAEDVLLAPDGAVLAGAFSAEPSGEAAEDARHWAVLMSAAAGEAGPPLRFRKVIDGCLHPDPDLRPTPRELVRMLTGTGTGAGAGAGTGTSTVRMRPRRRVLVPSAAGALAVAAVAATALVAARDESADPADAPETVVTDCTEAEGFAPAEEREADDLEVFSHMVFSPDGDLLAMHTLQDELSVWDWRESREVARPSAVLDRLAGFGFLPEGCGMAAVVMEPEPRPGDEYPTPVGQGFDLVSGTVTGYGSGGSTSGTPAERLPAVNGIAVSPDGLIALTGSGAVPGAGVQLVDSGSGETVGTIDSDGGNPVFLDERRLALRNSEGSSDWSITVWDVHTGERLHTVRPVADGVFAPVPGTDEVVHVHGGEVIVWDVVAGHRVDAFDMEEVAQLREPWVREIVVDPWLGRVYVMWWDFDPEDYEAEPEVYSGAWDLESGESLLPEGLVPWHVAPHPNGKVVAVTTEEAGVRLLDPETWEPVGTL